MLTELRELIADIQKEYETKLPFDLTLVNVEHLISVTHTPTEIMHPEE